MPAGRVYGQSGKLQSLLLRRGDRRRLPVTFGSSCQGDAVISVKSEHLFQHENFLCVVYVALVCRSNMIVTRWVVPL